MNTTAVEKPLSWYQRNKEKVREERRRAYAENINGFRDKAILEKRLSYHRNKTNGKRRVLTAEQKARKKQYQHEWYQKNKDIQKLKERARYQAKKDHNTSVRLRGKFGIDLDTYNAMLAEQGGCCAVCGEKPSIKDKHGNIRRLAVDHDHKTGKVRQLLCTFCNTSIGAVKENVQILSRMIDYINRHGRPSVKTVTVDLTIDEVQAMAQLIDAGIKSIGIQGVKAAASIIIKLETAVAAANAATEQKEAA